VAHASWTFPAACLVTALLACTASPAGTPSAGSTLPEYAAPKGRILDPASVDLSDVISYRTLVQADFKGSQPPPEFSTNVETLGAATCAYILTSPDTQVMIQPVHARGGEIRYEAWLEQLRFRAQMNRNCSWWNPKNVGVPAEYVLEHEQIHFALFELEARRLNAAAVEIEAEMRASARSPEVAVQEIEQRLTQRIEGRMQDILARSRQFDEDTSMGHEPERQKRWWNLVHAELAEAGG
jgi:hypothetical protein